MRKLFLLFLLSFFSLWGAKLPEIEPKDVSAILQQIMEGHATHKNLSPLLIERALTHFLEDLDPIKTYFLEEEVVKWAHPSHQMLEETLKNVEAGDFSLFDEIRLSMQRAILRRERLERAIAKKPLPEQVRVKEFKELPWAKNEEDLSQRLLRIRALQMASADKLDSSSKEKVLARIEKKRHLYEEEFATKDLLQRKRACLSSVLKAFATSFDSHTAYFTPAEASQFMISVQQRLFGIGAQLRDDLSGFTIVKILEGSPAEHSTLKTNDRVIAIDKEPVVGMEITDAVELIRGTEGTKVILTVLRGADADKEEKIDVVVTRGEVVLKEARIETKTTPFGDGVIAHIALHGFYQDPNRSSAGDMYEEIAKIRKDMKIRGIILDLRDNAGGILPQAVAVTGLFITKGIVVGVKDNKGKVEYLREIDGRTTYDGPLVVLTSKGSASASEIVAQTLQDYGRAIIVGDEHTYGKGTFQTFTLDACNNGKVNPKGEFKVTRGRYYTVSGKSPQLVGVKSDIVVPGPYSALEIGESHAQYPLENDSIPENFRDDLSDIPLLQRDQVSWLYRFNLQPKMKMYTRFLETLRKNSEIRLQEDKLYQSYLSELKKDEEEEPNLAICEFYRNADLQLKEAVNVLKDLVFLLNS